MSFHHFLHTHQQHTHDGRREGRRARRDRAYRPHTSPHASCPSFHLTFTRRYTPIASVAGVHRALPRPAPTFPSTTTSSITPLPSTPTSTTTITTSINNVVIITSAGKRMGKVPRRKAAARREEEEVHLTPRCTRRRRSTTAAMWRTYQNSKTLIRSSRFTTSTTRAEERATEGRAPRVTPSGCPCTRITSRAPCGPSRRCNIATSSKTVRIATVVTHQHAHAHTRARARDACLLCVKVDGKKKTRDDAEDKT